MNVFQKVFILGAALLSFASCGDGTQSDTGDGDQSLSRETTESEPFEQFTVDEETQEYAMSFEAEPETDSRDEYAYSHFGPYSTTTTNYSSGRGYLVYHPRNLDSVKEKMPILTWANPTAFDSWVFYKLLHLAASYGMVVVASHDVNTGSGDESIGGIDLMIAENEDRNSPFYQRLNTERIGAFGHSQGGMGTLNAVEHDPRITASAPLHPGGGIFGRSEKSAEYGPMLIITGEYDAFAPPRFIEKNIYEPQRGTAVMAVRKGVSHYGPVSALGGDSAVEHYTTAWFLLHLLDRSDLQDEFFGSNCHICGDRKFEVETK